eukprot:TRINITY_DN1063_c0_g1_i3.p1 TRINITY_DN1063_c0_g1~~TRINITY_DN1063_c0_g1_i3.p1  ORF type:complete len:404 (-),score=60.57 TRINITY_DN1063_c0_g1_i3:144-1199(-)
MSDVSSAPGMSVRLSPSNCSRRSFHWHSGTEANGAEPSFTSIEYRRKKTQRQRQDELDEFMDVAGTSTDCSTAPRQRKKKMTAPSTIPSVTRTSTKRVREGWSFLTYGTPLRQTRRYSGADWKHYELSQNGEYIQWYSKSKKIEKCRVYLKDIVSVAKGSVKCHEKDVADRSFSITYGSKGSKVLDLVAWTPLQCDLWVKTLKHLVKYYGRIKELIENGTTPKIMIEIKAQKPKGLVRMIGKTRRTFSEYNEQIRKLEERLQFLLTLIANPVVKNHMDVTRAKAMYLKAYQQIMHIQRGFDSKHYMMSAKDVIDRFHTILSAEIEKCNTILSQRKEKPAGWSFNIRKRLFF